MRNQSYAGLTAPTGSGSPKHQMYPGLTTLQPPESPPPLTTSLATSLAGQVMSSTTENNNSILGFNTG